MQVYAKDGPGRWVIFDQKDDGTTARLYSTNRAPKGMKRVQWPIGHSDDTGSIASMIKIVGGADAPQA